MQQNEIKQVGKFGRTLKVILVALLILAAGYLAFIQLDLSPPQAQVVQHDPCMPSVLPETIQPYTSILRAFDDSSLIAFNLTRDKVVEPTMELQAIRRDLLELDAPLCVEVLKNQMAAYMDSIINVLIAFIAGAAPADTQDGLELAQSLRSTMEMQMSNLLGATLTPFPTPYQQSLIPVTGSETQVASAISGTPTVDIVLAEVQGADGANLRFGPGTGFSFEHVVPPRTVVQVIGISEDGQWGFVVVPGLEEGQGWLYLPLLSIDGDTSQIPIIASP